MAFFFSLTHSPRVLVGVVVGSASTCSVIPALIGRVAPACLLSHSIFNRCQSKVSLTQSPVLVAVPSFPALRPVVCLGQDDVQDGVPPTSIASMLAHFPPPRGWEMGGERKLALKIYCSGKIPFRSIYFVFALSVCEWIEVLVWFVTRTGVTLSVPPFFLYGVYVYG